MMRRRTFVQIVAGATACAVVHAGVVATYNAREVPCNCPKELIPYFGHRLACQLKGQGGERVQSATLMTIALRATND